MAEWRSWNWWPEWKSWISACSQCTHSPGLLPQPTCCLQPFAQTLQATPLLTDHLQNTKFPSSKCAVSKIVDCLKDLSLPSQPTNQKRRFFVLGMTQSTIALQDSLLHIESLKYIRDMSLCQKQNLSKAQRIDSMTGIITSNISWGSI